MEEHSSSSLMSDIFTGGEFKVGLLTQTLLENKKRKLGKKEKPNKALVNYFSKLESGESKIKPQDRKETEHKDNTTITQGPATKKHKSGDQKETQQTKKSKTHKTHIPIEPVTPSKEPSKDIDSEEEKEVEVEEEEEEEEQESLDHTQTEDSTNNIDNSEEIDERSDNTIFVGNLPVNIGVAKLKKTLKQIFSKYGKVSSVRLRSAGFANTKISKKINFIIENFNQERDSINSYIVFESDESPTKALAENGSLLGDKHIRVDLANNKTHNVKRTLFIGNLPFNTTEEAIRSHFSQCGDIENVRVVRDTQYSMGKGFAFISFKNKESLTSALELDGSIFNERPLRVMPSSKGEQRKKKERNRTVPLAGQSPAQRRIQGKDKKRNFEGKRSFREKIPVSIKRKKRQTK